MNADDVRAAIEVVLADRRLLAHPFYQRWEAGRLHPSELAAYAAQYRHFEEALPSLLGGVLGHLDPESSAAELVRENLADEESNPQPHARMFGDFANAVGARATAPTAATHHLLDTYRRQVDSGAAGGLAALTAYEVQAPAIAATKAAGLRTHYGLEATATLFWDVHAEMDLGHSAWAMDALAQLPDADAALSSARAAADAWWAFLDEREAAAGVAYPAPG